MQQRCEALRNSGKRIGIVPTMGYLHRGHLSLVTTAARLAEVTVVSIFVNPTQFGPGEDLDAYPRDPERDLKMCREVGADIVFTPTADALYPPGYETYVSLQSLPNHLCGRSRPVHFQGVATIVTKLFHIVKPHAAVFGQKDFQQLQVIRRMVRDLNMDIEIHGAPTVREDDGLAMSSRNRYLDPDQRRSARCLYRALQQARSRVAEGVRDAAEIIAEARHLIDSEPGTRVDYIAVFDPETLTDVDTINGPTQMALAVKIGKSRLIDNMPLSP